MPGYVTVVPDANGKVIARAQLTIPGQWGDLSDDEKAAWNKATAAIRELLDRYDPYEESLMSPSDSTPSAEQQARDQQFAVSIGPFSGRIHAGLIDEGKAFTSKQDCTDQALVAAAIYVLRHEGEVVVTDHYGKQVRLRAEVVEP